MTLQTGRAPLGVMGGSRFASLCEDSLPLLLPCSLALLTTCQCGLCPQVNSVGPFTLPSSLGAKYACHSLAWAEQLFLGAAPSP